MFFVNDFLRLILLFIDFIIDEEIKVQKGISLELGREFVVNDYCSYGIFRIIGSSDYWLGGYLEKEIKQLIELQWGSQVFYFRMSMRLSGL